MAYTVKELARVSGVSVCTLHWYDELGLWKPSSHGPNSYRQYEEAQLGKISCDGCRGSFVRKQKTYGKMR